MPAEVISLCDYRKKKGVKGKSKGERGPGQVINLKDGKTAKISKAHGESLKGRGFPDSYNPGPDEPSEDFTRLPVMAINGEMSQEHIRQLCRQGVQWCHMCENFTCCDNMNPDKPDTNGPLGDPIPEDNWLDKFLKEDDN